VTGSDRDVGGQGELTVVRAPRVLLDGELATEAWVAFCDGEVLAVGQGRAPAGRQLCLPFGVLAPGLVDLQLNGAFGQDFAEADDRGWAQVMRRLPETGVTSVLPTFITAPVERLVRLLRGHGRRIAELPLDGARCLGIHLEGPFLSPSRRGAHRRDLLLLPEPGAIDQLVEAGGGSVRLVTLAPELPGGLDAVHRFTSAGVRVAIGHSDATAEVVTEAADAGASLVTHLFNAQRPFSHRDPGVVGAALTDPRLTLGLIADGYHVAPTAIRLAFAAAGERVALVSDAVPALGLPPGRYRFGGDDMIVSDPARPPERPDGTLAGSTLTLDTAVRTAIAAGVAAELALSAATVVPANAVGAHRVGRLRPGAHADLVWFGDDWRLIATWLAGRVVHRAPDQAWEPRIITSDSSEGSRASSAWTSFGAR
jgi:N-acetylglucosamine-6-phosphate deacetylase